MHQVDYPKAIFFAQQKKAPPFKKLKTICKPLTKQIFLPSKKRRPPKKRTKQIQPSNHTLKLNRKKHSVPSHKKQIEADDFESRVAPRLQPNLSERSELCRLNLGAMRDSKQKRTLRQRKKRFLWFVSLSPQRNEHPPRHWEMTNPTIQPSTFSCDSTVYLLHTSPRLGK